MRNKHLRKIKKIFIVISLIMLFLIGSISYVQADTEEDQNDMQSVINEQMQTGELDTIKQELNKVTANQGQDEIQGFDPQKILDDAANGKVTLSWDNLLKSLGNFLFKELYQNVDILVKLVILIVLCSLLSNLQASFLSKGVGELAFYVCYVVVVAILIVSFKNVLSLSMSVIDGIIEFMKVSIPILITLLMAGGNIASAAGFEPLLLLGVNVISVALRNFFIPMLFLGMVLSLVNNISEKFHISRLAGLFKQICTWGLGLILTIFIGVLSVQGTVGAIADGVTSKTAKFAISTVIPVAGKYLADAADTVVGCGVMIKNAANIGILVGIIAICIAPILKILVLIFLYRLTAAVVEPIAESRILSAINDVASSLTHILAIVASVAFMFLLTVTAIIAASNATVMMR